MRVILRSYSACISPNWTLLEAKLNGSPSSQQIQITTDNDVDHTIVSLVIEGDHAADFMISDAPTLPYVITANSQLVFTVSFGPKTATGPRHATLKITLQTSTLTRKAEVTLR